MKYKTMLDEKYSCLKQHFLLSSANVPNTNRQEDKEDSLDGCLSV
jgi:hypothetical protein